MKLLFSFVMVCLLFLALEGILALTGVQPIMHREDPFVGFAGNIPLFATDTDATGLTVLITAANKLTFFNRQEFPRDKPAGTYRLFCLGGSTTYGRPHDDATSFAGWLRELLPVADPSQRWEVINAGGISYASYRVTLVMEELCRYEPDLFVIYTGHNEFLEERTYGEILDTPASLQATRALASRTRVYAALSRLIGGGGAPRAGGESRQLLPEEVDVLLDRSIGPMDYTRDDVQRRRTVNHFRFNLDRMIELARSAGAEVLLVNPAANLRDCAPFKSEFSDASGFQQRQALASALAEARQALATGQPAAALAILDRAAGGENRHAHLHYLRGQALWSLERRADAAEAFVRARDEDVCPLRALSALQGIVAEVAAARNALLVDFARTVARHSPQGVPGEEIFLDHVHPTIAGHRLLAEEIIDALTAAGIVQPTGRWGRAAIDSVGEIVTCRLDREKAGQALLNLARVIGWAGKKEEAYRLARRGLELVPDDAVGLGQAGTYARHIGKLDEAEAYFLRALAIDRDDAGAHNGIGLVLRDRGQLEEAIASFQRALELGGEDAMVLMNLGSSLCLQGRLTEGIPRLRRAHQLRSRDVTVAHNLANGLVLRGHRELQEGRLETALSSVTEAVKLRPQLARAHRLLARIQAERGDLAMAVSSAQRALDLARDQNDARLARLVEAQLRQYQAGEVESE